MDEFLKKSGLAKEGITEADLLEVLAFLNKKEEIPSKKALPGQSDESKARVKAYGKTKDNINDLRYTTNSHMEMYESGFDISNRELCSRLLKGLTKSLHQVANNIIKQEVSEYRADLDEYESFD